MTEPLRPDQPPTDPAAETSVTAVPTASHTVGADSAPAAPVATPAAPAAAAPVEPETPVATEHVVAPGTLPAKPRSRGRWIAAAAVVGAVVVASAAIGFALTASSGAATVTGYVPADSIAYAEVRLDLPGDQRAEVAEFLSKFPGFADQAALETKLDEVLDRLISEGSDGKQTFTKDIKPWFDGELAVAAGPLPADLSSMDDPEALGAKGRSLALISIKDEALARAWFDAALAENGVNGTTETYGDTQITTFPDAQVAKATPAYAIIDGKVVVAGDVTSVKAAIDTNGSSGFANTEGMQAAAGALEGDHIGYGYVALGAIVDAAAKAIPAEEATAVAAATNLVPDWMAFRLRVEGDALVMDSAAPHVEGAPGPDSDHANGVAAWAPPTTIALGAGNDVGATIDETIDLYRDQPGAADALEEIEQAAGILGGLDGIYGWMGDTGVVVTADGETPSGGLVSIPTDAAAARQFFTTIRSFAALGGDQLGITVSDEDYQGTTITIVDLGSLDQLAGMAGALGGGEVPTPEPGSVPSEPVKLAFAATDGVIVIGSDADFVKAVLDAGPGPSLADDARYQAAVGRVGAEHTSVSYVDIAAVRTLIESHLDEATAEERAEYEESVKPFLTPFDTFAAATVVGGDTNETHAIVTVK